MASTNFHYTPTTGNGNTNVSVCAVTQNASGADYSATLTFSNGQNSKSVSIVQRYKPFINVGPTNIPASGGSQNITAHTEYDVVFRSVPTWITAITINGVTYSEGDRIPAGDADGQNVYFHAEPNTGSTSRNTGYENMTMGWYMNSSDGSLVTTGTPIIDLVQAADTSGITTDVDSLTFDYNDTNYKTVQVITNGDWTSTISDN